MLHLRTFSGADFPTLWHLKQQAGWNQTHADLERFRALEPTGCFLAELESTPVGSAIAFTFDTVGWIAMVLVDPAARGQGIGTSLMQHALHFLDGRGVRSVRLDATPLGQPIYEKLGFQPQFKLQRFAGLPSLPGSSTPEGVDALHPEWFPELCSYDRAITRTQRTSLLTHLLAEGATLVLRQAGLLAGYVMSRPGANAAQIGPCLAEPAAGTRLLEAALARHAGQPVYVDVPVANEPALRCVTAAGLTPQRDLLRMCRGEPISEDVTRLWASSGPEKG
ncbi:MAG: GNAT family N-acetyltransferase [Gemmataceae bacterium]